MAETEAEQKLHELLANEDSRARSNSSSSSSSSDNEDDELPPNALKALAAANPDTTQNQTVSETKQTKKDRMSFVSLLGFVGVVPLKKSERPAELKELDSFLKSIQSTGTGDDVESASDSQGRSKSMNSGNGWATKPLPSSPVRKRDPSSSSAAVEIMPGTNRKERALSLPPRNRGAKAAASKTRKRFSTKPTTATTEASPKRHTKSTEQSKSSKKQQERPSTRPEIIVARQQLAEEAASDDVDDDRVEGDIRAISQFTSKMREPHDTGLGDNGVGVSSVRGVKKAPRRRRLQPKKLQQRQRRPSILDRLLGGRGTAGGKEKGKGGGQGMESIEEEEESHETRELTAVVHLLAKGDSPRNEKDRPNNSHDDLGWVGRGEEERGLASLPGFQDDNELTTRQHMWHHHEQQQEQQNGGRRGSFMGGASSLRQMVAFRRGSLRDAVVALRATKTGPVAETESGGEVAGSRLPTALEASRDSGRLSVAELLERRLDSMGELEGREEWEKNIRQDDDGDGGGGGRGKEERGLPTTSSSPTRNPPTRRRLSYTELARGVTSTSSFKKVSSDHRNDDASNLDLDLDGGGGGDDDNDFKNAIGNRNVVRGSGNTKGGAKGGDDGKATTTGTTAAPSASLFLDDDSGERSVGELRRRLSLLAGKPVVGRRVSYFDLTAASAAASGAGGVGDDPAKTEAVAAGGSSNQKMDEVKREESGNTKLAEEKRKLLQRSDRLARIATAKVKAAEFKAKAQALEQARAERGAAAARAAEHLEDRTRAADEGDDGKSLASALVAQLKEGERLNDGAAAAEVTQAQEGRMEEEQLARVSRETKGAEALEAQRKRGQSKREQAAEAWKLEQERAARLKLELDIEAQKQNDAKAREERNRLKRERGGHEKAKLEKAKEEKALQDTFDAEALQEALAKAKEEKARNKERLEARRLKDETTAKSKQEKAKQRQTQADEYTGRLSVTATTKAAPPSLSRRASLSAASSAPTTSTGTDKRTSTRAEKRAAAAAVAERLAALRESQELEELEKRRAAAAAEAEATLVRLHKNSKSTRESFEEKGEEEEEDGGMKLASEAMRDVEARETFERALGGSGEAALERQRAEAAREAEVALVEVRTRHMNL